VCVSSNVAACAHAEYVGVDGTTIGRAWPSSGARDLDQIGVDGQVGAHTSKNMYCSKGARMPLLCKECGSDLVVGQQPHMQAENWGTAPVREHLEAGEEVGDV
jgi:hypothetical protein